jgi:hypothetical protein
MNAVALKAHYDGEQICLDEPYPLVAGERLLVVVPDASDLDTFRAEWLAASQEWLARAYDDDEPDYSDFIGKPPAA